MKGWLAVYIVLVACVAASDWIDYEDSGTATMTHYDLPEDYIASCGCVGGSTHYPTAALSQMAFGSSTAYGPACGRCFNLTLLNTYTAYPPFFPDETKSVVVKVTDKCPLSQDGWCSGTKDKTNSGGQRLNFDLAYPSDAISDDFFPSNASLYGFTDFGVWNITYEVVTCKDNWAGYDDTSALGAVDYLGPESACCPVEPTGYLDDSCPSYSDHNGIAYVLYIPVIACV
ncbi:RlpA-like double-psi beta-barrel-protein domain-containing protein-containing protein [Schizophyllum amplum]|uniref:RlpA-like double-psi beta-barrel-protein domain-containing protein-containing protein n=1 Tax=Schizophyllum amplum TaxID=97359 RepID=A0A550CWZ3_9AGAR|nr:RlpA-like double-psi beta-barrel-protein domain-containing protein-containing protein [Auriculariopsis ampla]